MLSTRLSKKEIMTTDKAKTISIIQHEAELFMFERNQIRLLRFCFFLLALLIATNMIWIIHFLEVAR